MIQRHDSSSHKHKIASYVEVCTSALTRLPAFASLPSGCPIARFSIFRPLGNVRTPFLLLFAALPADHKHNYQRCTKQIYSLDT